MKLVVYPLTLDFLNDCHKNCGSFISLLQKWGKFFARDNSGVFEQFEPIAGFV